MKNPNARVLIVPKEYGATDDDTYFGSIGDATQRHVGELSDNERVLWEAVITTRDGNIFRPVPNLDHNDPDTLNIRGKDLELLAEKFDLDIEWIQAELAAEEERQENSEDALIRGELIPFDEYERFPGMEKHIDLPTTPRDRLVYLGNCSQEFYDEFPEGHPDAPFINIILRMLNRDWDEIDEDYGNWVKSRITASKAKPYVRAILCRMVDTLVYDEHTPPDETKADALRAIDKAWRIEYRNQAAEMLVRDPMFALFLHKEKEWDAARKRGINVLPQVKSFGKILHDSFRTKMRRTHWERYWKLKKKYAPKVMYQGVDLNRCGVGELKRLFSVERAQAVKIWMKRPYTSLAEIHNLGLVTRSSFSTSDNLEKVTSYIERNSRIALEKRDRRGMSAIAQALVDAQRTQPDKLSPEEWKTAWVYYRLARDEFNKEMSNEQEAA